LNTPVISPTLAPATADTIAEAFASHLKQATDLPGWWLDQKRAAFAEYQRLPMPTRREEDWRFASLQNIAVDGYDFTANVPAAVQQEVLARSDLVANPAGQLVFADGALAEWQRVSADLAAKGVIWAPISEALKSHPEVLKDYFMEQAPRLGSEKFAALHTAFVTDGVLLYVPKGVEIELPFIAYHWAGAENGAVFPHSLLIAEEHAKVTLVDAFFSRADGLKHLACGFNHVFAEVGAQVSYYQLQDWCESALGFQIGSIVSGRDAQVRTLSVNVGCSHFRGENQSLIKGEGARVEMLSLCVADNQQEFDQRTLQSHAAGNSFSDLLYKNALMDDARTIFSGTIRVEKDAQKTDAYQTNRNLLLTDSAEAVSMPGLEIEANDVKCSHGATTGQIEENELFYMLARGINLQSARELIIFGFFEEVIEKIQHEELADKIRSMIQTKVRGSQAKARVLAATSA
jgi:Fe-S cluster assembly protein SufD